MNKQKELENVTHVIHDEDGNKYEVRVRADGKHASANSFEAGINFETGNVSVTLTSSEFVNKRVNIEVNKVGGKPSLQASVRSLFCRVKTKAQWKTDKSFYKRK